MLLSIALIFILSLSFGWVLSKLRLPALIGMIFTGMILGPYCLDLISPGILNISAELRKIALIIILIRAGLSLNIKELRENGMNIILMSFMPALFEVISLASKSRTYPYYRSSAQFLQSQASYHQSPFCD